MHGGGASQSLASTYTIQAAVAHRDEAEHPILTLLDSLSCAAVELLRQVRPDEVHRASGEPLACRLRMDP